MTYRIIAFALLAFFYAVYLGKMLLQRKKGIKTDQMGKGNKSKKVLTTEIIMKIATYGVLVVEIISIVCGDSTLGFTGRGILVKIFGIYIGIVADLIFLTSVVTMRDSWRAGIPSEDETKLVTNGIYKISRNPAFLGFDLLYISILLMYFNWFLLAFTIFAMVMLHLQILQEEKFLPEVFGEEYMLYKKTAGRYLGFGKWNYEKFKCLIYIIAFIFSIMYYITCVIYAGVTLSFVWIWLLLAGFSGLRALMLIDKIVSKEYGAAPKLKLPAFLGIIYRIFFIAGAAVFLFIEANVIISMNMEPKENLDYVIVLGAGIKGTEPSRPLYLRIQKAYNYMNRNPETVLIASGGRGGDEKLSEAQVIYNKLTEMGLSSDRIILEDQSRDTMENIENSYAIINKLENGNKNYSVGIVSNGFHLYRTRLIVMSQGHEDITCVPAQTLFPVGIHYVVREFFGVVELVMKTYVDF